MNEEMNGRAGYGKILDAWQPPINAGEPVGCIATSYTFSPEFFEDECLTRFLRIESENTTVEYILEKEEKLARIGCAIALVDQHHCKEKDQRSLRWDLVSARIDWGILHCKIVLLRWTNCLRLIISSANITENGYRQNREVFGVLDYGPDDLAPVAPLHSTLKFLIKILSYSSGHSPGVKRCKELIERLRRESSDFKTENNQWPCVEAIFAYPGAPSNGDLKGVLGELKKLLPYGPPKKAYIVSPFFDPPEVGNDNNPAYRIWDLMNQRGEAVVAYLVETSEHKDEKKVLVRAPGFLEKARPIGRSSSVELSFESIKEKESDTPRPLHLKTIWLENDSHVAYMIGSSNFTSKGLGLSGSPNLEANLAYIFRNNDSGKNKNIYKSMDASFRRFNSEVQHLGEQEGRCYPKWLCQKENMYTCLCLKET